VPEAPGEPGTGSSPRALLATAVECVAARVTATAFDGSPDSTEGLLRDLGRLHEKVDEALRGADREEARAWAEASPHIPLLARLLGHELLHADTIDTQAAPAALAVLRALAAFQGERVGPEEADAAELDDLATAMRRADAFELLVEVAHDFRSPLTSILFLAEALRDGHSGPVNEVQRSQLGIMYGAAFALASVASDVMELARGKQDLTGEEVERFPLSELLGSVERMVQPMVEEKSLELRIVAPQRAFARGHRHPLRRVLLNLTTNALKFTDQGSVELGVRPVPDGGLEFYVRDTGRGIAPEEQEHLFAPFRRRDGPEESHYFSGTGVGLSIASRLVRAMGSELRLDFSGEGGTQFSFVLPPS
jgi:signal transduction histidine kinase